MSSHPPNRNSPMAVAFQWAAHITTVCVEMVLPGLVGVWIDGKLGTRIVFALVGFGGGMAYGIWHLIRLTSAKPSSEPDERQPRTKSRP